MKNNDTCPAYRSHLAMLQDEPSIPWPVALEAHGDQSADCAEFSRALGRLPSFLAALHGAAPPADLFERIRAEAARPERTHRLAWSLQIAAGLVGFMAISPFLPKDGSRGVDQRQHTSTTNLFAQLKRSLGSVAEFDITPESELLAHLTKTRGQK